MNDPKDKKPKTEECDGSLDCAEQVLHDSVSQNHPEWVNKDGDCDSCVSIEHEMAADPTKIPEDL